MKPFEFEMECCTISDLEEAVDHCICGPQERVLRGIARGEYPRAMDAAERLYCIEECMSASEGGCRREDLEQLWDKDLARQVLSSWSDYVKDHF